MITILEFINGKKTYMFETVVKMFEGSNITKDVLIHMLSKLDMEELKGLSEYLYELDKQGFIAYQPNDDDFINDSNKEAVITKISDYFNKYVLQKQ